ncbi:MAG: (d)CMP kinase, partial [Treponema sp.]
MIIAIDGPAGTGKSTIAALIAEKLHITYLNSGSFYRALTLALLESGSSLSDEKIITDFCRRQKLEYKKSRLILNGTDIDSRLHEDKVSAHVAQISAIPEVRHIVNARMRGITNFLSIVCEGRDMTTVVFPNAEYKFYLDATPDVQAERRYKQGVSSLSLEEIKNAIKERDEIDKNKKEGALKIASDAFYIDTSTLTIEQVCAIILNKIHIKGSTMETQEVEKDQVQSSKDSIQTQLEESLNSLSTPENGQLVDGTVIAVTDD